MRVNYCPTWTSKEGQPQTEQGGFVSRYCLPIKKQNFKVLGLNFYVTKSSYIHLYDTSLIHLYDTILNLALAH